MELTTKGIKQIMTIARPAIIRLYGRQPLKLNSYKVGLIYANTTQRFCLVVDGKDGNRFYVELVNNKEKVPEVTQVLKYEDIPDADTALATENKRLREVLRAAYHYIGGIPLDRIDHRDADSILAQIDHALDGGR